MYFCYVARPTKYDSSKNQSVIDLMSEGASIVEVAGLLDIDKATLYRWIDVNSEQFNQEFCDTIKRGLSKSQEWWEKKGRTNLENKDFNYTGWYMNMKNRFRDDWQEVNKNVNQNKNTNFNKNIELTPEEIKAIDKAIDEKY